MPPKLELDPTSGDQHVLAGPVGQEILAARAAYKTLLKW
jgi:hypothetical protein